MYQKLNQLELPSSPQLDIVGQNYVSPNNISDPLVLTEVERVAFSSDGMWLATFERRDDKVTTPEIRLKFWLYIQKSHRYKVLKLSSKLTLPNLN